MKSDHIKQLAHASGIEWDDRYHWFVSADTLEALLVAARQSIYDSVKEELIPDELINIEPDSQTREYLKGCNGGTIDALIHIKNWGEECDY